MFDNDLGIAICFLIGGGICYLLFLKDVKNPLYHRTNGPTPSNYYGMWGVVIMAIIMFIVYLFSWLKT